MDIDPQAVEVTKLSLLLKVLEGENQDTLERQMKLFKERALPDLGSNIKCGNSLIGPDFYQGKQMNLLDREEMYRINPFDWEKEFPEIMKRGGFDAVIGNPPYIRIQTMKEWAPSEVEIYKEALHLCQQGQLRHICGLCRAWLELAEQIWAAWIYLAPQILQCSIWRTVTSLACQRANI